MKEQKIIFAVDKIDDDLISEAAEYRPEEIRAEEVSEGVMYSVPAEGRKTRWLWRYPVTAAAALAIAVGALFVINNINRVHDSLTTYENAAGTSEATAETQEGVVSDVESNVTEAAITQVTPIKELGIRDYWNPYYTKFKVLYVDSLPKISNPALNEEYFTEMSTEELFEYYGLDSLLPKLINDDYEEVRDENTLHGIYTLPDGSVEDVNTFVFVSTRDMPYFNMIIDGWNRLVITVGKESKIGQEYVSFGQNEGYIPSEIYYDEGNDTFFAFCNVDDSCRFMVSGTSDDIMFFNEDKDAAIFNNEIVDYRYYEFLENNDGITPSSQAFWKAAQMLFYEEEEWDWEDYYNYLISSGEGWKDWEDFDDFMSSVRQ